MSARVVPISPYITLGKIETCLDHLLSHAIYHRDETVLQHVNRLKRLREELSEGMNALQQWRTVEQLEASIALRKMQ